MLFYVIHSRRKACFTNDQYYFCGPPPQIQLFFSDSGIEEFDTMQFGREVPVYQTTLRLADRYLCINLQVYTSLKTAVFIYTAVTTFSADRLSP